MIGKATRINLVTFYLTHIFGQFLSARQPARLLPRYLTELGMFVHEDIPSVASSHHLVATGITLAFI